MNEVKLGDKVKSKVSGFDGIITAKCEYLYADTQYQVTALMSVDGEVREHWFAVKELILVV